MPVNWNGIAWENDQPEEDDADKPDELSPAKMAEKAAGHADDALVQMDGLQERADDLLPDKDASDGGGFISAEMNKPAEPPAAPDASLPEPAPSPVAEALAEMPRELADKAGRDMDTLEAKEKPVANPQPQRNERMPVERKHDDSDQRLPFGATAKQKRNLARDQFKQMHDLTAKVQEATGRPEPVEIGGLNEADAEVVAIPREDQPEALKRRWKDKEEADKEFRTVLVGLLGLEAEGISECTRQIERIHSQLERTRYY